MKIASLHDFLKSDCELLEPNRAVFIGLYNVTNGRPCDDCVIKTHCKARHDLETVNVKKRSGNTMEHETNQRIAERIGVSKRQVSKMRKAGLLWTIAQPDANAQVIVTAPHTLNTSLGLTLIVQGIAVPDASGRNGKINDRKYGMKASDLRRLIGKTVTFKSDRTSWLYTCPTNTGIVIEVVRTEVYIAGDWHNIKTIEIIKVHEEEAII